MSTDRAHVAANTDRFSGFAELYDRYRPRPPEVIVDLLTQLAAKDRPVVVDLGSGSGLSTLIWTRCAAEVVGVEPNADMRAQADERRGADSSAGTVRFIAGLSTATGLPDSYADIVTCSQSLHWMEPNGTLAEVARILRDNGVFAAYDCDWPPTLNAEAEQAYNACRAKAEALERLMRLAPEVVKWNKGGHLERIRQSGHSVTSTRSCFITSRGEAQSGWSGSRSARARSLRCSSTASARMRSGSRRCARRRVTRSVTLSCRGSGATASGWA